MWLPKFLTLATSLEKVARVQAIDVFSQMSSDSIKSKLDIQGLPYLYSEFKNNEDAKAWLLLEDQVSQESSEVSA